MSTAVSFITEADGRGRSGLNRRETHHGKSARQDAVQKQTGAAGPGRGLEAERPLTRPSRLGSSVVKDTRTVASGCEGQHPREGVPGCSGDPLGPDRVEITQCSPPGVLGRRDGWGDRQRGAGSQRDTARRGLGRGRRDCPPFRGSLARVGQERSPGTARIQDRKPSQDRKGGSVRSEGKAVLRHADRFVTGVRKERKSQDCKPVVCATGRVSAGKRGWEKP